MQAFLFNAVRYFILAREAVISACCPRRDYRLEPRNPKRYEESWVYHGQVVLRKVNASSDDSRDVLTKIQVFYDNIEPVAAPNERLFASCRPPWFFIGCDGDQDRTAEMEPYICRGNEIKMALLRQLFPGSKKWVYIHPTTFEETNFPSKGISIEND